MSIDALLEGSALGMLLQQVEGKEGATLSEKVANYQRALEAQRDSLPNGSPAWHKTMSELGLVGGLIRFEREPFQGEITSNEERALAA